MAAPRLLGVRLEVLGCFQMQRMETSSHSLRGENRNGLASIPGTLRSDLVLGTSGTLQCCTCSVSLPPSLSSGPLLCFPATEFLPAARAGGVSGLASESAKFPLCQLIRRGNRTPLSRRVPELNPRKGCDWASWRQVHSRGTGQGTAGGTLAESA